MQVGSARFAPGYTEVRRTQAAELAEHPMLVDQLQGALYRTHSKSALAANRQTDAPAVGRVPDGRAIADDQSLRFDQLNHQINITYGKLARRFQAILDPNFTPHGTSDVPPTWYLFAAYSSKTVGKAEILCGAGLDTISSYQRRAIGLRRAAVQHVPLPKALLRPGLHLMDAAMLGAMGASALIRNWRFLPALNIPALLEPREALITAGRLIKAGDGTGADDVDDLFKYSMNTLRNTLEQANRAIFTDLGVAGCDYLNWRDRQQSVTPDKVLAEFTHQGSSPEEARSLYNYAVEQCKTSAPTDIEKIPHTDKFDTASLIPASFALFEKAAGEKGEYRTRLIECANNMLLFREQYHIVQPVYTPGYVKTSELDRNLVMKAVTPAIRLNLGDSGWKLTHYAREQQTGHELRPAASEYNWAAFEQRWDPILDSLQEGYTNPSALWPAPNPDPRKD